MVCVVSNFLGFIQFLSAVSSFRTQGSTKIFKSPSGSYCKQKLRFHVENNACLVFAPDPTTCFDASCFKQNIQIALSSTSTSSLLLVDWYTSGRKVRVTMIDFKNSD